MVEYATYDEANAPEESKETLAAARKSYGMTPNILGIMAEAPGLLSTYWEGGKHLTNSSFSKEELSVLLQTSNVENNCEYCVPASTLAARNWKVDEVIINAMRDETTARLEALRDFTLSIIRDRGVVDDGKVQAFLDAGFTQRNVLEVVLGVALKVMSNYTNHLTKIPLDKSWRKAAWQKKSV